MNDEFVDTDVIVRLITGDDPVKRDAAAVLFQRVRVGAMTLRAPDTVIADAVYVLTSPKLYRLPRAQVRAELAALIQLPGFRVHNRRLLLRALDIFSARNIDFGDAMIIATMERREGGVIYSYDHDFNSIPGIDRREP